MFFQVFFVLSGFALAKSNVQVKTNSEIVQAEKILQKYNQKSGFQIKLEVLTEKKVLGTKIKDKGTITQYAGKINLALQGERKSEMIFDGKQAYLIAYPDQELDPDGNRKVILLKPNGKNQLGVLSNLFGNPKKFFSSFNIKTATNTKDILMLKLSDKSAALKPMTLTFSKKEQILQQLSYTDDVESIVQINFEKPNFNTEISSKLFKYNAKKSDEVVKQ